MIIARRRRRLPPFYSAYRCMTDCNLDISPPGTGSEERAKPSSEPRRSDTSSATPAESSLLQEPCPGRSHATPQPRTPSTIQREALSPGSCIPQYIIFSLIKSYSVFLCFFLSVFVYVFLSLLPLSFFSQLMLLKKMQLL